MEEEAAAAVISPPPSPSSSPSPPPSPAPSQPPSPPPASVCSKDKMVAGCECASQGFGHGLPDNPSSTSPLCCDKATKKTVTGAQITSWVTCVQYSPPPRPPPPLPPPPSPPPNDVCSKDNMVAGCKCASQGFGHGKPDNPSSTSPLCCDKATKKTAKGAQIMSWVTCVQYSPPPRPPPPLPPPPSPPPNDICSTGNFFEGCKKCGITLGKNCPPVNTGLCCHKASKVAVKGARSMSNRWCGTSIKGPSGRHLLAGDSERDHRRRLMSQTKARSRTDVERAARVGGWMDFGADEEKKKNENDGVPETWFQGVINGTVTVKHPSLDVDGLKIWASLLWSTRGAGYMTLSATLEYGNEYLALEMHMVVGIKVGRYMLTV